MSGGGWCGRGMIFRELTCWQIRIKKFPTNEPGTYSQVERYVDMYIFTLK